jgi:hypothetical protein
MCTPLASLSNSYIYTMALWLPLKQRSSEDLGGFFLCISGSVYPLVSLAMSLCSSETSSLIPS